MILEDSFKSNKEPIVYRAPFGSVKIPPYPEIDLEPYTIETTSLSDATRRFITSTTYADISTGEMETVYTPSDEYTHSDYRHSQIKEMIEGRNAMINIESEKEPGGTYRVICRDKYDLSLENVLRTISAVKGRLMLEVAPIHIHITSMECKITPVIRHNIITASKKLNMYGKDMPIIARFDDYGNRLPDTISINGADGVSLKIVDPQDYGEVYFELTAHTSFRSVSLDDLPF